MMPGDGSQAFPKRPGPRRGSVAISAPWSQARRRLRIPSPERRLERAPLFLGTPDWVTPYVSGGRNLGLVAQLVRARA